MGLQPHYQKGGKSQAQKDMAECTGEERMNGLNEIDKKIGKKKKRKSKSEKLFGAPLRYANIR